MKKYLIDSNNIMRLTVDSLVDIGNITTRPNNITLR